eukprot:Em0005g412a
MATTETVLLVSPVNVYSGAPMDGVGVIDTDTVAGSSGNRCPVDTTDAAWQQAQLSLSRGGLGMRSLSLHSPAAFTAFVCSSGYGSPSNHHLSDAIQKFNESVSPSDVIQFDGLVLSTVHQNQLSSKIDIHQFNNIMIISSVADKACLLSVLSPHAASWLTVVPSEGLGLHLLPSVFQVAVKWWLGLDTSNGSLCALCPNNALDPLGHHATTCKEGGDVVTRHNQLRNVLAETCRIAHLSVKVEMGSNLTSEHDHSRPADILLPNWALGKPAAFDISVTSPLNPKIISVAGLSAGAAALSTEERKHTENDPKCNAFGWCCVPLVTESYGAWGKEAMDSFKMLASRLAIISGKPKSVVLSELKSRLNLHLVRANATAILSRTAPNIAPASAKVEGLSGETTEMSRTTSLPRFQFCNRISAGRDCEWLGNSPAPLQLDRSIRTVKEVH